MWTVTKGFDVRLANRPIFDLRALWRSAKVLESQKLEWPVSQPGIESLN